MESGESYCIKKAAGNAVAILAKKDTKAQMNLAGAGAFGTLVQLLQSGSAVRKSLEFQVGFLAAGLCWKKVFLNFML